jgi:hypothetical protein
MSKIGDTKTVDVTQMCIDHGVRSDCRHCPIALAAAALFPGKVVEANGGGISVYGSLDSGPVECWSIHATAAGFMRRFDGGARVLPFAFEIKLRYVRTA